MYKFHGEVVLTHVAVTPIWETAKKFTVYAQDQWNAIAKVKQLMGETDSPSTEWAVRTTYIEEVEDIEDVEDVEDVPYWYSCSCGFTCPGFHEGPRDAHDCWYEHQERETNPSQEHKVLLKEGKHYERE